MTVPADDDDRWLHRLIFDVELTEDNKIHPAAWERFRSIPRLPQWKYVLSGTSWKIGKKEFLANATNIVNFLNKKRTVADQIAYRGLIYQTVQHVRDNSGNLNLDVHIVQDPRDPSHAILVTTAALKNKTDSISPEIATQLNQLFILVIAGSHDEQQVLA